MPRESYFVQELCNEVNALLSEAEKPQTPSRIQRLSVAERSSTELERSNRMSSVYALMLGSGFGETRRPILRKKSQEILFLMKSMPHSLLEGM
jgi:hypothetical protein